MAPQPYESTGALPRDAIPPTAADTLRTDPADDLAPPVEPNLVRPREVPGARQVGRNTVEILVFRGLSTPLALGLVVLQSRFLAPEGRGAYVVAVLGVTIFSRLLGQLGVAVANRLREHEGAPRTLALRALGLGVALGAAAVPLITLGGTTVGGIDAEVAFVTALALVPNVMWQTVSGILLGQARVRLWNYVQLGSPVLTLMGMLVLVVWLDADVLGAVSAWAIANVLTAVLALGAARDLWLPFEAPRIADPLSWALARLAVAMGAVQVVNLVSYRIELFILERHEGLEGVGLYSIAMQAAEALWLVAAALATAITAPAIHEEERAAVRLVRRTALRGLLLTAGIAAVLGAAAPFAIPVVFGEAFSGSARPLLYLLPGVVLYGPVAVLVVYLSVRRGRPRLSLLVSVVGGAVTLALALVLIPRFGTEGAAVASSIGYAIAAALAWLLFARLARRSMGRSPAAPSVSPSTSTP